MNRRNLLNRSLTIAGAAGLASVLDAQHTGPANTMPAQAETKPAADPEPHVDDIGKFPKCNYCGMDRKRFHHSRMLLHYLDGTAEGVCSIRCAATSLSLNLGRGTKALWVGDNAASAEIKPLTDAETATYLVGSSLRGVMTRRSKVAYSTAAAAEASKAANGGELADFDKTLLAAYTDIAEAVAMSRKTREERIKRMQKKLEQ
ncbi:nitrous oxide reductase accessory protein NosL [Paludibaculum fermentans]|uniref:nitrous oxide reductase accessory protein NosL n=1 Tax=Paludibaculum fermentans TaxID=1473598 RepID=UPI003EB9FB4D